MIVTLDEMKQYLRVDFEDDDALIGNLIQSGHQLCMDISEPMTLRIWKITQMPGPLFFTQLLISMNTVRMQTIMH